MQTQDGFSIRFGRRGYFGSPMLAYIHRISLIFSLVRVVMGEQRFIVLQTCLCVFEAI